MNVLPVWSPRRLLLAWDVLRIQNKAAAPERGHSFASTLFDRRPDILARLEGQQQMPPVAIPATYRDLFDSTADTKYFALITAGVTSQDAATLNQARAFYKGELSALCMEKRNQPLPANGLILANATVSGQGAARFYTEERLIADGFPIFEKARLVYHFDNGKPIEGADEYQDGSIKNPNRASKSQTFEVHDLIRLYFDPHGEGGKNKVWDQIKDAVS